MKMGRPEPAKSSALLLLQEPHNRDVTPRLLWLARALRVALAERAVPLASGRPRKGPLLLGAACSWPPEPNGPMRQHHQGGWGTQPLVPVYGLSVRPDGSFGSAVAF